MKKMVRSRNNKESAKKHRQKVFELNQELISSNKKTLEECEKLQREISQVRSSLNATHLLINSALNILERTDMGDSFW